MRSTVKDKNLAEGYKAQVEDVQKGGVYESRIAVTVSQKILKAAPKRSEGPKEAWTYIYYHPDYCTVKGHKDCRSPLCLMTERSKEERLAALKVIQTEQIEEEVKKLTIGE